jgi:ribosome-associated toxin RatA of RatAB toxin-antitoxin module
MRKVSRSALVPYSAEQMYALVKDVESYPAFLPWCNDAEVHIRGEDFIEASLELHRGRISKKFRTRNQLKENEWLGIELVGGPFRHMSGGWVFQQLGDAGSKVTLDLEFACNSLVDSFTKRAAQIYAG